MKKVVKLFFVICIMFLMVPLNARAESKVTVYLFWGEGCPHCENAKVFFDSIKDEYSEYFELKEYETYGNANNRALKEKVHDVFDMDPSGVPFIVIGDEYFVGYGSTMDEQVINTIIEQYNNDAPDIVQSVIDEEEIEIDEDEEETEEETKDSGKKILLLLGLSAIVVGSVMLNTNNNKKK